jgi:anti-sigma factor (TIGR02949 family)
MSECHDPRDPSCREVYELLSDYVDGDLPEATREALSRHLGACPPCERFLNTFRKTRDLCREGLVGEMPEELKTRLRSFLRDRIGRK